MLTRRELLTAGAGLAGGALAGTEVLEALASTGPRRRGLEGIEHIVVFMQENRSFDHYFGTLRGVRGFADKHALKLPNGRSVFFQPDPLNAKGHLLPFHMDSKKTAAQCSVDLSHAWIPQHDSWNHGRMNGWIAAHRKSDGDAAAPFTMGYLTRRDIPFHYGLADAFTICDAYHCSVIGPTDPNRLYLWSATIDPHGRHGGPLIDNFPVGQTPSFTWTTYPERLQRAGISWRVYQEKDNFDDNALAWFRQYQQAGKHSPLAINGVTHRSVEAFADDICRDRLPQVSWIVAPTLQSEHPPFAPNVGAALTSMYLRVLAEHPKVWRKTAFLLCWDENDGFFDHVRPRTPPKGTRDEFVGGRPIGLGFRVPMIVISPWSTGGFVCSQTFDHTSIIRLIERRFGVREPNISAWRRKVCGDLTSAFDFGAQPRRFPRLPSTKGFANAQQECAKLPATQVPTVNQKFPRQEPGTRPRRPLPRR